MTALLVLLLIGASVRLTRLLTTDYILERPRALLGARLPDSVSYLVRCDWCMSVYVGLAVFLFGRYAPDTVVWVVSGGLTASLAAGWSATLEAALDGSE